MATVSKWTPFGVALDITATGGTVTRTSATQYTVKINASWETYYSGAATKYGMTASSGNGSVNLNSSGTTASSGSGSFTGTYSISGNGAATKTVTVTFRNYNSDNGDSATKNVSFSVSVPAWTSYAIAYNANGGSNAPGSQTKWKDQTLKLSTAKPTRTGYSFLGWSTSSTATSATYAAGGNYTANAAATLYAVWKANTYTITYNANGGSGTLPSGTKTYNVAYTIPTNKPTRTNYTFLGWSESASATSATYSAGGTIPASKNADIVLYAVWKLAYTKPRITGLSVTRCDSSGNASNSGTYARVKFDYACDATYNGAANSVIAMAVTWSPAHGAGGASLYGDGKSVNQIVGGAFNAKTTYTLDVFVSDNGGTNSASKTLKSQTFLIQGMPENKGISFGKSAEKEATADFEFDILARNKIISANDKSIFGIDTDGTEYSALIPVTASGNTSLGHGLYKAGKGNTHIYGNAVQFYTNNGVFMNGNKQVFNTNAGICGKTSDGAIVEAMNPMNENGNVVIGYGNYNRGSGNSHLYGYDLLFGVSNISTPGTYRPYFRQGMSVDVTIRTAGYVTNAMTEIYFYIPLSRPIIGSPTATATSRSGFILRQNDKYTHGSSATAYVTPTSYTTTRQLDIGVFIVAKFSNTTNCVNNSPIGIHWDGTITFT